MKNFSIFISAKCHTVVGVISPAFMQDFLYLLFIKSG